MKHQVTKAMTTLSMILTFAFLSVVAPTHAQAHGTTIVADVPFEFIVANRTFQAGEITVRRLSVNNSAVSVSSAGNRQHEVRLAYDRQAAKRSDKARLVFHKYRNRYYLAQIWTPGETTVRELPKSRSEKSLQREMRAASQTGTSENGPNFETVSILAKLQ